jgi:hypothetical protein
MAKNQNTPVRPKLPKIGGEQKPANAVKTPELEQTDKQPVNADLNSKANTGTVGGRVFNLRDITPGKVTTVTVRTIGVPSGRRFRASIEFTATPLEIDLSTLNDLQRNAIESDPHLKID